MLIGIIKNEINNTSYYIHLDNNKTSIIETTNDSIRSLDKLEAISLYKTLLSSKLTYKERYNEYDVYLDEANNKRYFKNGIENLLMFFENNGESAILYSDKTNKIISPTKAFKFIAAGIGFTMILSTISFIPIADDTRIYTTTKYVLSSAVELTPTEAVNLINNSIYLTQEEKEHLANPEYFDFVIDHTETKTREYYLRNSLNNIQIKHYDPEKVPGTEGYYNPLDINAVNVSYAIEQNSEKEKDVIAHEFVHLTQAQNRYFYLMEATAEILEYEYFDEPCDGYQDLVKRTKVLMEIIGPEPVASCVFSGDTTYFENTIREYLDEEDANKLLELFKTPANVLYESFDEMVNVNAEIDNLLAKMYYNKTGNSFYDDLMIRLIYISNTDRRIYFNTNHEKYKNDYYLTSDRVIIDELNIEDVINSGLVKDYKYAVITDETIGSMPTSLYRTVITKDFYSIVPEDQQILNIDFKDGSKGLSHYDLVTNTWGPVEHYKMVELYEQPIYKKFPDQIQNKINIKEIPEKEEGEAKLI